MLENHERLAYLGPMDIPPTCPQQAPQAWVDAMDEAEADMKAGRTVDSAAVIRGLDESIAELRARTAGAAR
jgi:hypothetical protein